MIVSNYFSSMYNEGVVIYAQSPTRRIIKLEMGSNDEDDYGDDEEDSDTHDVYGGNFFLSFPYVFHRVHYKKLKNKVHAASLTVMLGTTLKLDKLFYVPLPNIEEDGRVCLTIPSKGYKNEEEMCKDMAARFWATKFEDTMYDSYSNYDPDSLLGDHRKWQTKTKAQPKWIPNARSLKPVDQYFGHAFLGKDYDRPFEEDDE